VTLLQGVYIDRDREVAEALLGNNLVSTRAINEWLALRDTRVEKDSTFPPIAEWLVATGRISEERMDRIEAGLLSTWLGEVRDNLHPVHRAGDSIYVYRIPGSWR
jgi:hypothetical protein